MSIQTIAVVAVLAALPVMSQLASDPQAAARRNGAVVAADYDYEESVSSCSLSLHGDQPVLSATLVLSPEAITTADGAIQKGRETARTAPATGQHIKRNAAFDIVPATSGGMPVVTAMAINTKGTGATNGRSAAPACDVRPSPGPTLTGTMRATRPTASCTVSDDGMSASVSVPLSAFGAQAKPYRGHVTLMKRGGDVAAFTQGGWGPPAVVAACTGKGVGATYDLATLKKA